MVLLPFREHLPSGLTRYTFACKDVRPEEVSLTLTVLNPSIFAGDTITFTVLSNVPLKTVCPVLFKGSSPISQGVHTYDEIKDVKVLAIGVFPSWYDASINHWRFDCTNSFTVKDYGEVLFEKPGSYTLQVFILVKGKYVFTNPVPVSVAEKPAQVAPPVTLPSVTPSAIAPAGAGAAPVTLPSATCAPGDELKNVFVKLTNGQYIVYVKSAGYDIPVAYTNRRLTTITPISALLGLTIMGINPKNITDPSEYRALYDAIRGVLPAIQDEMLFMRGKANYAIRIDSESHCMRTDKLRFLLEEIQDRYLMNLVPPEAFVPGEVEAPTKIPERYKIGIPVEIGVPAEKEREAERLASQIRSEISQLDWLATQPSLKDYRSEIESAAKTYSSELDDAMTKPVEERIPALRDILSRITSDVERYRRLWREIVTAPPVAPPTAPPAPTIPTITPPTAPPVPAKPVLPADVVSSIDRATSLISEAERLSGQIESRISKCTGVRMTQAASQLRTVKTYLDFAKSSAASSLQSELATIRAFTGIAAVNWESLKPKISWGPSPTVSISPIPGSILDELEKRISEARSALEKYTCAFIPRLGSVDLYLYKPPMSATLYAYVIARTPEGFGLPGVDVTVYYNICPIIGWGCLTSAEELRRKGNKKSARTGLVSVPPPGLPLGTPPGVFALVTLSTNYLPIAQNCYAFAEARYRGVTLRTGVVRIGGFSVSSAPPAPPAPAGFI